MIHELPYWEDACFVTFTYDTPSLNSLNDQLKQRYDSSKENWSNYQSAMKSYIDSGKKGDIPSKPSEKYTKYRRDSLDRKEVSSLIDSIESRLKKQGRTFAYYIGSEYGDEDKYTHRPHYHGVFFGLHYQDEDTDRANRIRAIRNGDPRPYSDRDLLLDSWSRPNPKWEKGSKEPRRIAKCDPWRLNIKPFHENRAAYVASYIQKSSDSFWWDKEHPTKERPFAKRSRGLGLRHALDNAEQYRSTQKITINGVPCSMPKYYADKIGIEWDETQTAERRKQRDAEILSLSQSLGITEEEVVIRDNLAKLNTIRARLNHYDAKSGKGRQYADQFFREQVWQHELDLKAEEENRRWRIHRQTPEKYSGEPVNSCIHRAVVDQRSENTTQKQKFRSWREINSRFQNQYGKT